MVSASKYLVAMLFFVSLANAYRSYTASECRAALANLIHDINRVKASGIRRMDFGELQEAFGGFVDTSFVRGRVEYCLRRGEPLESIIKWNSYDVSDSSYIVGQSLREEGVAFEVIWTVPTDMGEFSFLCYPRRHFDKGYVVQSMISTQPGLGGAKMMLYAPGIAADEEPLQPSADQQQTPSQAPQQTAEAREEQDGQYTEDGYYELQQRAPAGDFELTANSYELRREKFYGSYSDYWGWKLYVSMTVKNTSSKGTLLFPFGIIKLSRGGVDKESEEQSSSVGGLSPSIPPSAAATRSLSFWVTNQSGQFARIAAPKVSGIDPATYRICSGTTYINILQLPNVDMEK